MADATVGLVLAIIPLVLELQKRVQKRSIEFHHLDHDLGSFHETLFLTQHYLRHLHGVRKACETVGKDIEKLLARPRSRVPLRQSVKQDEIETLRSRMQLQITFLTNSSQ